MSEKNQNPKNKISLMRFTVILLVVVTINTVFVANYERDQCHQRISAAMVDLPESAASQQEF